MGIRTNLEISVKGKWIKVPALDVGGYKLVVRGKRPKIAVVWDEDWLESEINDPDVCLKALKEEHSGSRADIFTFVQKPPATAPRYDYPMEWESVAVVSTGNFKEWWEKLPQETRKNVRRAQKRGVTVKVCQLNDELISELVDLNNDSAFRQRKRYRHYGKSFEQVRKDHLSFLDRSELIGAYFGDELIGFVKLVYRGEIASILEFLPKSSHKDKRPANALIAKAVEICEAKGIPYMTYGLFNYGNKHDCSLREFKIRNGFVEILVPRYYVPLTARGRFFMKLRLHHGLLGMLPQSLITLCVAAREKWHNFKRSLSRRSLIAERPRL